MLKTCFKLIIYITLSISVQHIYGQNLEPRSLSSIPIKGNFLVASYAFSSGNILIDNTLPIEDLNANINSLVFAYARSFKLFNKLAKFDAIIPLSLGNFSASVNNVDSAVSRVGLADPSLRLSMILIGAKPLKMQDFFNRTPEKFKLGASIRVRVPIGQYNDTKLINLGANRWGMKMGLIGSYNFSRQLILEAQLNTWVFTKNNRFFNGNTIHQKALVSGQIHLAYIFKNTDWLAISYGGSGLGETVVNGIDKDNLQNNTRFGLAYAKRINKNHALKAAFTSGISTRYGANFSTILLAYQFIWFDKN